MRQDCFDAVLVIASCTSWLGLGFSSSSVLSGLEFAPRPLRGLGGIDLSMGRFFEPGGRSDRTHRPEVVEVC